jgi:hypothetical protein
MPYFPFSHVFLAAAYGQLGELESAQAALKALTALVPSFASVARRELSKWWDAELVNSLIDGLRKAGLQVPD